MLRALPPSLRERVAVAVDGRLWQGPDRWQGILAALSAQGFPFVKSGGAIRSSLDELGRWLDDGYAVIISPEGDPERNGELLPFLDGTGLMAVELGVPVVPFKVEGYDRLFSPTLSFPYLPSRRGRVRLIIGEPIALSGGLSPARATEQIRQAFVETR
jgi:long-chain acyl-CoA synthetase